MTANKILEMIEAVDPADTAMMDEIDARVWCWLKDTDFEINGKPMTDYYYVNALAPHYTRSRDALKAIRPDGWVFRLSEWQRVILPYFVFTTDGYKTKDLITPDLPTEELAELHAIIQSIEYDRGEK